MNLKLSGKLKGLTLPRDVSNKLLYPCTFSDSFFSFVSRLGMVYNWEEIQRENTRDDKLQASVKNNLIWFEIIEQMIHYYSSQLSDTSMMWLKHLILEARLLDIEFYISINFCRNHLFWVGKVFENAFCKDALFKSFFKNWILKRWKKIFYFLLCEL